MGWCDTEFLCDVWTRAPFLLSASVVHGALDLNPVAPRFWKAGELVVAVAGRLRAVAGGDRVQSGRCLSRVDGRRIVALSVM